MPSGTYVWSQTAATNSGSDSAIGWAEGQAPSSINDSARAMMAVLKKHDDDISGAIVTGGTSTSYTVATYSVFDSLAHMGNQLVAFTPHTTNGATVVLNVDGLGAKPLRSAPSVELLAGTLIQGTPYTCIYNSSDQVFYLHGFFGNAYNIPLAGGLDYWGATAPNSAFAFPYGQAISRTTYAGLFSLMGTAHGVGDGSTTFNLPDKRGRVSAGVDTMGGSGASRLTATGGMNGTGIGSTGGGETASLSLAQLPTGITAVNAAQSISVATVDFVITKGTQPISSATGGGTEASYAIAGGAQSVHAASTGSNSIAVTSNNTSGNAHLNVQPTITCNYIIRIL